MFLWFSMDGLSPKNTRISMGLSWWFWRIHWVVISWWFLLISSGFPHRWGINLRRFGESIYGVSSKLLVHNDNMLILRIKIGKVEIFCIQQTLGILRIREARRWAFFTRSLISRIISIVSGLRPAWCGAGRGSLAGRWSRRLECERLYTFGAPRYRR